MSVLSRARRQTEKRQLARMRRRTIPTDLAKSSATVLAPGLVSIDGQAYKANGITGAIGATVEVYNAGSAGRSDYQPVSGSSGGGGGSLVGAGTGAASGVASHALDGSEHTGDLAVDRVPLAFARDGSNGAMLTSIDVGGFSITNVSLVDGVDIGALATREIIGGDGLENRNNQTLLASGNVIIDMVEGPGLEVTANAVTIRNGDHLIFDGNDLAVECTSDAKTNPGKVICGDTEGDIALRELTVDTIRSTGDLTIDPAGGDILIEHGTSISTTNYLSGFDNAGWGITYNGSTAVYTADFQEMIADSLTVKAFTADVTRAFVGSDILTKSRTRLARSYTITSGASTMYVDDEEGFPDVQVFENGDYIRIRYIDRSGGGLVVGDTWGTVSNYSNLADGQQSWTFTRDSGQGGIGQVAPAGMVVLDYGKSGDGYIHSTTLDSSGSPYIEIATWTGNPYTPANKTTHTRYGNLDGIAGVGAEWGLFAGKNTATEFARLSDTTLEMRGVTQRMYEGSSERIRLDASVPSIAVGLSVPTWASGTGIWQGIDDGKAKMRVGVKDGNGWEWDGSSMTFQGQNLYTDRRRVTYADLEVTPLSDKTVSIASGGVVKFEDGSTKTTTNTPSVTVTTANPIRWVYVHDPTQPSEHIFSTTSPSSLPSYAIVIGWVKLGSNKASWIPSYDGQVHIGDGAIITGSVTAEKISTVDLESLSALTGSLTVNEKISLGSDVEFTPDGIDLAAEMAVTSFGQVPDVNKITWYDNIATRNQVIGEITTWRHAIAPINVMEINASDSGFIPGSINMQAGPLALNLLGGTNNEVRIRGSGPINFAMTLPTSAAAVDSGEWYVSGGVVRIKP